MAAVLACLKVPPNIVHAKKDAVHSKFTPWHDICSGTAKMRAEMCTEQLLSAAAVSGVLCARLLIKQAPTQKGSQLLNMQQFQHVTECIFIFFVILLK
jgi:hypothetical protein